MSTLELYNEHKEFMIHVVNLKDLERTRTDLEIQHTYKEEERTLLYKKVICNDSKLSYVGPCTRKEILIEF